MDLTPGQAAKPSLKRSCQLRITQELQTSETYGLAWKSVYFEGYALRFSKAVDSWEEES